MQRAFYLNKISQHFKIHSVCALLGPRQVGKTTLAKMYVEHHREKTFKFFDLENPVDLAQMENPYLTLSRVKEELIIIDEIQNRPDLFPILRVLVDQDEGKKKYLILGSASRDLLRQSSETLAGRIGYVELPTLSFVETNNSESLWLRGGFPRSFLAESNESSFLWRQSYVTTFLERDIPALGFQIPSQNLRRFWLMLAHYHGQIFNSTEIGRSLDISHHTVKHYLDILSGTFMIRVLTPWFENLGKRQIKSPKIYFRDSGILNVLLGIENINNLYTNPKLGAFWEGFALEEIIKSQHASQEECYYWATQGGAELDLMILKTNQRIGYEFKFTENPKITKSMHIALKDLNLDKLYLVIPGKNQFPLDEKIEVLGLESLII